MKENIIGQLTGVVQARVRHMLSCKAEHLISRSLQMLGYLLYYFSGIKGIWWISRLQR
jgi:hypothetical protein